VEFAPGGTATAGGGKGQGETGPTDTAGNGSANTGGGGGGGGRFSVDAGNGGSGIVIIRYPDSFDNLTSIGAGLAMSAESPSAGSPKVSGGFKIYIFTGGTGTVTI
jgi:hypothetical protein